MPTTQEALAEFDAAELGNLTIAIGVINAYNRMAISFRREPQPPGEPG